MKEIFILRHGETNQNALGIVQGSGIDSSLSDKGYKQSLQFYNTYKEHGFDLIITSNLQRTHQTINPFLAHNIPIIKDERIREICWGEHEGKSGEPDLMEKYYQVINSWSTGKLEDKPIGGESALDLQNRLLPFVFDLEKMNFSKALICTHGRTLRALICILKNWSLSTMEDVGHSNTGLYRCTLYNNQWNVLQENDTTHLLY